MLLVVNLFYEVNISNQCALIMLNRHIIIFWLIASCRCLFWCAKPFLSLSEYELLFAIGICNGIIRSVIYPKSHSYPCYHMLRYTLSPMVPHVNLIATYYHDNVPWENKADLQRWKQIITWKQYIESRLQIWMLRVGIGAIVKITSNCSYSFTLWSFNPELFQFILWTLFCLCYALWQLHKFWNNACCISGPRRIPWRLTCLSKLPYQHQ